LGKKAHFIRACSPQAHSRWPWAALLSGLALLSIPVAAQVANIAPVEADSPRMENPPTGIISADLLRHPLPKRARQMLQKAQRAAQSGDHLTAIKQLTQALTKYPQSAAWIQPVLGIEYLKTDQHEAAVKTLEQAVLLLPRDAVNRSNFGFSLASTGQYDRAEEELHRALELDRRNITTRRLLEVVEANHRQRNHE
jgi:tetratricopeptide (TPR) repeat protein